MKNPTGDYRVFEIFDINESNKLIDTHFPSGEDIITYEGSLIDSHIGYNPQKAGGYKYVVFLEKYATPNSSKHLVYYTNDAWWVADIENEFRKQEYAEDIEDFKLSVEDNPRRIDWDDVYIDRSDTYRLAKLITDEQLIDYVIDNDLVPDYVTFKYYWARFTYDTGIDDQDLEDILWEWFYKNQPVDYNIKQLRERINALAREYI